MAKHKFTLSNQHHEIELDKLSMNDLILLYDNCAPKFEDFISSYCYERYGVKLQESTPSSSPSYLWFLFGGVLGALIIVIQNMIING